MQVSSPAVVLYDIDGTLVDCGGAGRRAMTVAFTEAFPGHEDAIAAIRFAGMTDRAIVRAGIVATGGTASTAAIDAVLGRYLEQLSEELTTDDARYRVHAGVEASLTRAGAGARVAIGLGTGNLEEGARRKLGPLGLWERFAFGGFGSDAEDRAALIEVGAVRGADHLGAQRSECRVLVIGDTPRDVTAAHACGARCLAVTTGPFSAEALQTAGADWVVSGLDTPVALQVVSEIPAG